MNLDVNDGGVFLDRELQSLNKRPHVRFFGHSFYPNLHPDFDVNNQTLHPEQHIINYVFSKYGKTFHPFYVEKKVESRKTFEGVVSRNSFSLDKKIPPFHLHPDFEVEN